PSTANMASQAVDASRMDWLAPGIACDPHLPESVDPGSAENDLRAALAGLPVDVAVQPALAREKKVLVADMASTMIGRECSDALADEVGMKEQVAATTQRAMNGEIEFEPALRERVALLKGLELAVIERVIN